ncbi:MULTISPECIES: double-strand break repair helicase AddA [Rhodobacterales]|jgi:ATP-dependent helicase/nuclease subunit A|uniref:double-strand break repair helicase AddA n=1 Tax=Rhodobacterales TaxID=204455 RepID=UPI00237FC138|nr:double-strand break repair helicase AddA [Phaeobacter gallaeciensis]MDE4141681.1 double-strand break repair helicase AddA [Phaeobacter gallaeciensis]MDE4150126.1 double-strand break repair helicase AddA [Phaeobacter gallaeciensis]MDE4154352.1 double-strand break repair helicase AddA [Phaeobacter gallaeciensis]MDE4229479.1 double-strand break repair helicase AddA [Phaeobacter gallaeciensis]MDE4258818.1 double-strand break repair helicase AddA [Phaeobacter gallaeciensis]
MTAPRDAASEAQFRAARPDASTWLAANAGSGKTKVLTDRVARLLLKGVQPQHILCLTYTKAAASEMQNRLFQRLGEWAMLGDDRLSAALDDLGAGDVARGEGLAQARTLFARAIETPGGLKIQTIHSFCSSLLRRFPLEAGVSPQFAEMEDRAATLLRAEIVEDIANGPEAHLVEALARHVAGSDFDDLTAAICQRRAEFARPLDRAGLLKLFDLTEGFDAAALEALVFLGGEDELLSRTRDMLATGGTNDQKAAAKLAGIATPKMADLPVLESVFLTGAGAKAPFTAKVGSFPTKKLQKDNPDLMDRLEPFMLRVEDARAKRLALAAAQKSEDLHAFAAVFLPEYERRKQLRGWLDFDDLILKARLLLNDPAVAAWVLYRLDGGIDHILVDEAQDTSPVQWDVIEKLAQEFTSGIGARSDVERTIFVVGDKKQSIYSFQGADPDAFDRMQEEFGRRLAETGAALQNAALEFSFRSSAAILRLVDLVFKDSPRAGFHKDALHRAFKSDLPGRVDLWPAVEKLDEEEDRDWTDPVDRPGARHHTVILAERIAREIKRMIDDKVTIPEDGPTRGTFQRRPVHAGDFLILVQRRSELFSEIIRACKAARLPIAGADRLKVGAELAVKDIAALLSFLATPEDSLSLAAALKSPLFGWSEQMLFDLAHRRKGGSHLWAALRDRATEYPETMEMIDDLRSQTDFLRPYDLIERILTRHRGRQRLLGRLGPEAEDGINALLSQALAYERTDIPSLTGFLVWMQTDDLEIKRQMGAAGDMIRVMSVHGSKGLEAPIVILPDTAKRKPPSDAEIIVAEGAPLWRVPKDQMPAAMLTAREAAQEKQQNERLRLLYVALTRAEKWLIVASAGELSKEGDSWYQMVERALNDGGAATDLPGGPGLRLQHGDWDGLEFVAHDAPEPKKVTLPQVFTQPAPAYVAPEPTLSPSDLGGAKALPGDQGLDEEAAKARGTNLHLLLEHLPAQPEDRWPDLARALLAGCEDQGELLEEASAVLRNPDLAHVFAPGTLSEVAVTADLDGIRLHGVIDRLIVESDRVLAVDFKSNATVPQSATDCPDGLLRQMGAYALALGRIYPGKTIETALIWTRNATLMPLPHEVVTPTFQRHGEP